MNPAPTPAPTTTDTRLTIARLPITQPGGSPRYRYTWSATGTKLREGFARYEAAVGVVQTDGSLVLVSLCGSEALAERQLRAALGRGGNPELRVIPVVDEARGTEGQP